MTVLLAPIVEELIFRQLMHNMWLKLVRPWLAVAVVALSFALVHMPYPIVDSLSLWKFFVAKVPSLFIVGCALGAVRLRLSLWHAIVFHMAVNGLLWFGSADVKCAANAIGLCCIPLLIIISFVARGRRKQN